jgi:amino acid adenylation domain-containing protein
MTNLPLTKNQTRLWLISKQQPDTPLYIVTSTYRLTGTLDIPAFTKSLDIIFQRHHTVFSVIKETDSGPYCNIVPSDVNISIVDFSDLPGDQKPGKITELVNSDSRVAFDLERGPLFRLYLVKTDTDVHYFHMSIHHIVFDGWSHGILTNELGKIYNSLVRNERLNLEEIEYQQYDYAIWESSSDEREESVNFWSKYLYDCSPVLNFPWDTQRTAEYSGKGEAEKIRIPKDLSDRLRQLGKSEGISLFTTMLGAFGLLLHKYSGEDDLNIGLPVAYRPHSKLENIFGMFVNTVVARLRYDKGSTFRQLIKQSDESAMNAISHQDLPFERVVEIIKPERSFNANPLFQVALDWQNNLGTPADMEGIRIEAVSGKERAVQFDMTLYMWENEDYIEGEIEYNLDVLNQATIIRLRDNFIHLLRTISSDPDTEISEISLVSGSDRKMLKEFNDTAVPVPDCLIQGLFEAQATLNPSGRAVVSGDGFLSFSELDAMSNRLARHLHSHGIKEGDVVGISMERTVDMMVSVLGVLKAGCCYLPMDPMFPDDRVKYMYEDSGAKALITQSLLRDKFTGIPDASLVLIDKEKSKMNRYSGSKPEISLSSQGLAYMIYTSGSTGKPKGVKVHHEAVVNFLNSMSKKPGFTSDDRLLAVTTLSFDISVLELFMPVCFGGELIIADSEDVFNGDRLRGLLDKHDITVMQATPATWNILLSGGWKGKKNLKALCGGEAVLPGLVKELLPVVESLWDMYGPTETTVWSACKRLTDATPPILVGRPIDNTTIHILDRNNIELPVGVTGEVCIGGKGVSRGYNNRPELTAEKFINIGGELIYKSGDLGRYLSDGNIE